LRSNWQCRDVDCLGDSASSLMSLAESGASLSGDALLALARGVYQIIDGDFVATRPGDEKQWLAIRAVDSSFYVVVTDDEAAIAAVWRRFRDVRESPEEQALLG